LSTPYTPLLLPRTINHRIIPPLTAQLDLIVTRLQTQRRAKLASDESQLYSSPFDALEKIYSNEGLGGLYSGWTHDTTASVASAFFYHFAYQFLRERRLKRAAARGDKTLGAVEELLVGSLAGVFSRFFTTPMNNLVTRKQTSGQTSEDGKPASSASIIRDIYREKGITGYCTHQFTCFDFRLLVWLSIFNSPYSESRDYILHL
jgi:hypothetical protein